MKRLEPELVSKAHSAFGRVFASASAYEPAFRTEIQARLLLFPIDGYELGEEQFLALRAAAGTLGEEEAYVSNAELPGELFKDEGWHDPQREHFRLRLADGDSYGSVSVETALGMVQNAIYSVHGRWGLLLSDEFHALAGGPAEFVDVLQRGLPEPQDLLDRYGIPVEGFSPAVGVDNHQRMLRAWLLYWKRNRDHGESLTWLPKVLAHVVGRDRAAAELAWAGLAARS